ncbi:PEP-CTERM sorting domain-containing protein [Paludisphaera mucosa]|uniref:PEP-CTERM sorting domain-containing protein n=1 Tax=Paludisphaera mucosa TaxID=3030827 RepID=A0ABT6FM99_9BACT|nr:PEP-CTERM sorting domain-containing protein [Paludisphaera mucosa]MDG3008503.1 PEP-CTERM sorting domain-containing protein [Paludisphaera mucosa]
MVMRMTKQLWTLTVLALAVAGRAEAGFLDVSTLSPSANGSFAGSLDGLPTAGAITANDGSFFFTASGTSFGDSTLDGSSPQYSYSNIYSPSTPLTDRIGYAKFASAGSSTVVISFGAAVSNLIFDVANLDGAQFSFNLVGGLTGLSLLRGNGGNGDGLGVSGNTILDLDPTTIVGVSPETPPPTSGARSGYGSVQLLGTYQTLTFIVSTANGAAGDGDGGSFTLSTAPVPEPTSLALFGIAGLIGLGCAGWRRKRNMAA